MQLRRIGMLQIIASGLCFGSLGVLGKLLFSHGASAGELLSLRFSLAALLLFTFHLFRNPRRLLIHWRDLASCALLGVFGYALFAWCFFTALEGISASLSIMLLYTYPALVSLGGYWFFQEKIPKQRMMALPIALIGTMALVWGDMSVEKYSSLLFGLAAAIFYSVYILLSSRLLRKIPADISVPYIQAFAGLVLTSIFLRDSSRVLQLIYDAWWIILLIALI
ncbi:MAG: DMT family transporter, partial [Proteobacteria bacterium]|nr:DMT family transporter [Pseudomonadota bacterium]